MLTPQQFVAKWRNVTLKERSAGQEHLADASVIFDLRLNNNAHTAILIIEVSA